MINVFFLSSFCLVIAQADPVIDSIMPPGKSCGQIFLDQSKRKIKVDCYFDSTKCFREINKAGKENGVSRGFTPSGKLKTYQFYKNGLANGLSLVWDSVGEVIIRGNLLNDNKFGLYEEWYTKAYPIMNNGMPFNLPVPHPEKRRLKVIYHYNAKGEKDGEIKEWWPNGNLKLEAIAKNGQYIESTEYYPNGNLRVTNKTPYDPTGKRSAMDGILFEKTYNPKGKAISEVKNGNGESIIFDAFPDSVTGVYAVAGVIIKNGSFAGVKRLTKEEVSKLLE